ncbi:hypothetical protein HUT03_00725 [Candidatus Liberibacter africanus]|uniref:Uncharacterized protein n=1 Tax=Candidatus Liberibacter africanus PTSAPSY TaxID=1277257 RepID=A0A0G3I5Q0_LIBAF|nr:hypothetical protein [Candidatus Liberibacter africanus]AKK19793.1 hypothetical protein G293_00745 [Candidatus Liberibacter africanus PTSAPSY]QTP63660.1 hypothetical protein HUT03_00725 [Candidatus Liberibacter africanus]
MFLRFSCKNLLFYTIALQCLTLLSSESLAYEEHNEKSQSVRTQEKYDHKKKPNNIIKRKKGKINHNALNTPHNKGQNKDKTNDILDAFPLPEPPIQYYNASL